MREIYIVLNAKHMIVIIRKWLLSWA